MNAMTIPVEFGVGTGLGLGHLTAEVHADPRGLGRTSRVEQRALRCRGHLPDRDRVGHDGVGDPPVLRDRAGVERVGDGKHLRVLAQLGQRRLDCLAVRRAGQGPWRRHREHHLCLRAAGARELTIEKVQCLLGLGPRNAQHIGGRLFHRESERTQPHDQHQPCHGDQPAMTEAPPAHAVQHGAHCRSLPPTGLPASTLSSGRGIRVGNSGNTGAQSRRCHPRVA